MSPALGDALGATWVGVPVWTIAVIGLIVLVGAFVQATIGLGLGLARGAADRPARAAAGPHAAPAARRAGLDRRRWWSSGTTSTGGSWPGRCPPGCPARCSGVWLVTAIAGRWLGVAVALMVLVAVALALHTVEVRQTPATLVGAGFVAGTAGTAVAVGGPPMAIVMAHRPPREVRGTLSLFFVVGSVMSVVWFAVVGELPRSSVVLARGLPAAARGRDPAGQPGQPPAAPRAVPARRAGAVRAVGGRAAGALADRVRGGGASAAPVA